MDRAFLATVGAALALLVAGVGLGAYLTGAGLFDEPARVDPAVTQFSTDDATCAAGESNVSVSVQSDDRTTYVTVRGNVSAPDLRSDANATLERVGLANYTLQVVAVRGSGTDGGGGGDCPANQTAVVPYVVSVQIPHAGGEPYRVVVRHGDERVRVVDGGPGATGGN